METNKEKLYIFDVCGTMFHSNTTYDFLLYYFRKQNKIKYLTCKVLLSYPSKAGITVLSKLGIRVGIRSFLISLLKDEHVEEVGIKANSFVGEFLEYRKHHRVHDLLDQALFRNERVILVSASLDPVVKVIAEKYKVNGYFASTLELSSSLKYSGKLKQDMKGEKLAYLQQEMDLEKFDLIVVTDNLDDISLVQFSQNAFIISKNRVLNKWKNMLKNHLNAEIIHV